MPEAASVLSHSELSLRLRQQELVAAFGRLALRTENLQEVLGGASKAAAEGLQAEFAKVLEYQAETADFLVVAGVGWRDGVVGHARLGGEVDSPAGYAFQTGKPLISNRLGNEQRFRTPDLLIEHGVESAINVLIRVRGAPSYGVLEVDSTQRGEFNAHDTAFLEALANTLGEALESHRRQAARETLLQNNIGLLREKELLMQEVHHRVSNSLQMVQSILALQAQGSRSAESRDHLADAGRRIRTIGEVHRRLYEGGSVMEVDAAYYLNGLIEDLEALVSGADNGRALALTIDPFMLPADDMTPLGLIASELVTNAAKYGAGRIDVEVRRLADGLEITVSDQGDGFPERFDAASGKGLGMRLVKALAKSPSGEAVRIDRSAPGARIVIRTGFGGHAGAGTIAR